MYIVFLFTRPKAIFEIFHIHNESHDVYFATHQLRVFLCSIRLNTNPIHLFPSYPLGAAKHLIRL